MRRVAGVTVNECIDLLRVSKESLRRALQLPHILQDLPSRRNIV